MNKKVVTFSVGLSVFLFGIMSVSAIVGGTVTRSLEVMPISAVLEDVDPVNTSTCIDLQSNGLRYRANDAGTNGEVSVLQDFLISTGLLKTESTGFFGLGTFSAVKQFQKKQGLSPTGYVGALTKVKIKEQSCSLGKSEAQDPSLSKETLGKPVACTMEARMCPDGSMMPRDPATCKWLESKCQGVEQSSLSPKQGGVRPVIISQEEQQRVYVCEKMKMACDNLSTNYNGFACKELTQLCEKFSTSKNTDTIEINPQNVFPIKKVVATSSLPRGCGTMEVRYCPNGTMMERDSQTCAWLTSGCTASSTKLQPSYRYGYDPLPPIRPVASGSPFVPKDIACTMQVKFCPNGAVMPRDANCGWHPEQCPSGDGTMGGIQCSTDPFSGKPFCGPSQEQSSAY